MAANYYDVLNVPKDADNKAISEAYKKMALKWHPDKNPDNIEEANRQFQQISQAYQVLSDSNKRLRYDRGQNTSHVDDHDCFDFYCDDDDDDDDDFGFFHFISPEMVFRHFFQQYEQRTFGAHNFFSNQRNNSHHCNGKGGKAKEDRRKKNHSEKHDDEVCQIRTVNGKQWMTKTYYEDGNKIVTRYEDGDLISKQINGVFQKISK